ncbi:MAG TPA: HAD-IIA family hydrolase [Micromonosporaceae bacterium]
MSGTVVDRYDLVVLDLDGVVYLGEQPIPGAAPAVSALLDRGKPVIFATNNASRTPAEVATLLVGLGVPATADQVFTSAQASARELARRLPAGSPVLVVGAPALATEVTAVGLRPVYRAADDPVAVVQGYAADVGWSHLAEACLAVRAGALWLATNVDRTLPSPRGPLPGNGSLVAALATALGRQPDAVVGKPGPDLFARAAEQAGARDALVVGDRLDTDMVGAARAGMDRLLVLTGVASAADLLLAPADQRPTHVGADLGALSMVDCELRVPSAVDSGWRVRRDGNELLLSGQGDAVAALRALCTASWAGTPTATVTATTPEAKAALTALGLTG